ncbi:MAG: hypothetical protein PW789_10645 [Edaphobacter sp.]|uniref:hypothetical protein n=1 Tax=Edaphobacter sp. TaxID=1934404 RepID=UPI00238A3123|nr:hypothetical protein [Edaphobacter sp.]MDE1177048.1 hypothetical protein [Edaphobacter sp.]
MTLASISSRTLLLTLAAGSLLATGCNQAQTPETKPAAATAQPATPKPDSSVSLTPTGNEEHHKWSKEQILTCTFHQCWELAGKNEDAFFDIVQELAVVSAKDRGIQLPTTEEAGRTAGEYIRSQARADNQQLLYAVVDAAVRKVGVASDATGTAATDTTAAKPAK